MKTLETNKITSLAAYIFIVLFVYTATNKILEFNDFQKFMSRLDLMHSIGAAVAWMIPAIEILISGLLLFPLTRKTGIYSSFGLMVVFTVYLIYMKFTASTLPCHCGGAIGSLSWVQHIWFNLALIVLAAAAIFFTKDKTTDKFLMKTQPTEPAD